MASTRNLSIVAGPDGSPAVQIHARGLAVLDDPEINRGTAFTMAERDHLGLHGLLPSATETLEQQTDRCYEQFKAKGSDVEKWVFLSQLHDSNEVLFYRLVGEHVHEMLPIVYTPTVGAAIQEFSHLFRRPRGVFLNVEDVDGIERALDATGLGPDDIDLVVASDAEAILGIGDWGVGGIDISIGKLAVYTVAAGIDPRRVLAVGLDVGTNRESAAQRPSLPRPASLPGARRGVRHVHRHLRGRRLRAVPEGDPALGGLLGSAGARHPRRGTATPSAPSTTTSRARPRWAWPACWPGSGSRAAAWSTRRSWCSAPARPASASPT